MICIAGANGMSLWFAGTDLLAVHESGRRMEPGPRFKEILEAIQTEQLEERILEREAALEFLRNLASA